MKVRNAFTERKLGGLFNLQVSEFFRIKSICKTSKQQHSKMAFTLAEVLITLGIIGIVVALTIPALIQNYQNRAWNTSSTVFESKLEEALKVMNTQQVLAGYKTTEDFVNELQKHLKIIKICGTDNIISCFEDTVFWGADGTSVDMSSIKMSAHLGQKGWNTKTIGLQFASGVNAVLAYNPSCKQDPYSNDVSVKDCVSVLYDVSGYSAPNTSSKDLRGYNVLSLGSKNCLYEIGNSCYSGISRPTGLTFAECEAVKDKLGIQNCYYGNNGLAKDMWAGAVLACGGIQYMPTPEQLKELANYLYKDNNGTKELDNDKVAQLGLNLSSGGYFYLWSNAEMDGNTCLGSFCTYAYWATGPTTRGGNHTNTDRRFICVGK